MAKKELIRQNLDKFPVLIDDKSAFSPDYLRITKLPTEFSAGTNVIKFKGNSALFSDEAEFLVEILDSNNDPVYYEVGLDLESTEQSGVITVYINQDTAPGPAVLYICTTIKQDIQKNILDIRKPNLRWSTAINIDPSKRNEADILFDILPSVSIFSSSGSYTNLAYNGSRIISTSYNIASTPLLYFNNNNQPALMTGSNSTFAFSSSAVTSNIAISSSYLLNAVPTKTNVADGLIFSASIIAYSGSGIAYLDRPLSYPITNANSTYIANAGVISNFTYNVEQSSTGIAGTTENSYNVVIAYFSGITPQVGAVSKIRSYYKSSGVGEYIFSNESIVSSTETEFGFTPSIVSMSFAVPTMQRNDKLDFKFEFVNPTGLVSKQIIESKNHSFIGGNTYIGGDDNLLTGSLYVAGNTGTGVHISGKGSSAMIRSIGYAGFQNATTIGPGGFVMYSGSIQPLLNSTEEYSGVGLELVANSASYFKYTTSGSGLLDIRTATFFLGNGSNSISGSNGNISISGSAVSINTSTFFLGNQATFISGSNGNILISGSSVNILTPSFNLGTSASYISGSSGKVDIYSSKFIVTGEGIVTASGIFAPKAFFSDAAGTTFVATNFGYGTGIVPMIEPDKVFIDATNIGRCVHPADPTEYSFVQSGTNVTTGPVFKTVTFHTMANETVFTVAFQLKFTVSGTGGYTIINSPLLADIYYIQSGSANQPASVLNFETGTYDTWTSGNLNNSLTPNLTSAVVNGVLAGYVYERVVTGRRLIQIPIPPEIQESGGSMQLRFKLRGGSGGTFTTLTSTVLVKNIEVLTGRDIGLNFKENFLGTPVFSAIGAAPIAGGGSVS